MGGDFGVGTQSTSGMATGRYGRAEDVGRTNGDRAEQRWIAATREESVRYRREIRIAETRLVSRFVDGRKQACRAEFDPSYSGADAVWQNRRPGQGAR